VRPVRPEERADGQLARIATEIARAEGRRDALQARAESLKQDVEIAKGRLALRGEVEAFIEAAHTDANRRNLAAFETLLTALVREVLPGEKPVTLELSTERGLAALDICLSRPDGSLEDVLEDNGGALTNVIGTALRLIAVVKAGVGRFLALDEADCWIAPERVPAFYRVLEDAAARLGVQCLAVSHHDLSAFEGQFHVSRIAGEPADGVQILSPDLDADWADDQLGLRFVRLVDVQAYVDATLKLSPGVNALIGPNNRGKSTFIRALRAVFYGEARDSLVRAGSKAAVVEIGLRGQRTLRFTRQPRRSPINIWSLHEADGTVVEECGTRYETGGRAVPPWVEALCQITKVEDLDVHIAHQKFPVFLLGESPSRRSAVLSIGQEAGYFRDMLALHRERCLKDNNLVRMGERELIDIDAALDDFRDLGEVQARLGEARAMAAEIAAVSNRLDALMASRERLGRSREGLVSARARLAVSADLPDPKTLAALRAASEQSLQLAGAGQRLIRSRAALETAHARAAVLQNLPKALPSLESHERAETGLARIAELRTRCSSALQRLNEAAEGMDALRAEMARLVDESSGLCPTCGATVDPDALLDAHAHPNPSVAA
jgi:AAA domain